MTSLLLQSRSHSGITCSASAAFMTWALQTTDWLLEDSCFLGCDVASLRDRFLTFRIYLGLSSYYRAIRSGFLKVPAIFSSRNASNNAPNDTHSHRTIARTQTALLSKPLSPQNTSLFKVCKSVHHFTIKINHQPDATVFQFIILTFFTAQHVSGVFPPFIRSSITAVADSGFTFVLWWQSWWWAGKRPKHVEL
jgi:hypothetical protein